MHRKFTSLSLSPSRSFVKKCRILDHSEENGIVENQNLSFEIAMKFQLNIS